MKLPNSKVCKSSLYGEWMNLLFLDRLTSTPLIFRFSQLGKCLWLRFVSLCSTTGHARELCREGSKVNEFYSHTEWFYLVFPLWLFHGMSPFFCSVLLMHSLWSWVCPGERWGCSRWRFLALGLGGGRGTTEPEETSKQQAASLRGLHSLSRSLCVPSHSSGFFLKFKAKQKNLVHRWTSNRAFVLLLGLSFSLFMSTILNHWVLYSAVAHDSVSSSSKCGRWLRQDSFCSSWIQAIKTHGNNRRVSISDSHYEMKGAWIIVE